MQLCLLEIEFYTDDPESSKRLYGEKLGLNGLMGIMHVESRYGQDANSEAGALAFPNGSMLYPLPDQWKWSISECVLIQSVCDEFALTIGKYNSMDLFNMLYRNQGRGIDGFMNLNLLLPTTLLRTTNLSFNGAGVLAFLFWIYTGVAIVLLGAELAAVLNGDRPSETPGKAA